MTIMLFADARSRESALRDDYLAATAEELKKARSSQRLAAIANQRVLFPHSGSIELTAEALTLGEWKTLQPRDVVHVAQEFIPEYNRFAAGGARGGFPSLGALKRTGAPLIVDLRTGERIVLLVGFEVLSGVTKNSSWVKPLQKFAAA
ncbi:hypothetical protein ACI2IX_14830 [Leifsonia aquatica]|uniref:hypothetical protein n=1 Tax=Leifsonia aquatica TaxID=144185 RepID=UPI00384AFBF9